jgi:hypothetical protein
MNQASECWWRFEEKNGAHLSQLRILRLGLFQDGDDGVGVFPERKEVLPLVIGFVQVDWAGNSCGA